MRDAMRARGPDGAGIWISNDATIGMAHRRLSIIDLSEASAQPMAMEDGSLRVVFNGEIYNYRALRAELEAKGHRFRTHSDTEVLLHLYADRGTDMMRVLRGMYAFAIWDERKCGLLLARDPLGIKPLYYADDGAIFRFASQVKALRQSSGIRADLEPAGYAGFYLWGSVPEPYTLYKDIRALPAGHSLWVDSRGVRPPARYFDLTQVLAAAEADASTGDARERQEHLRFVLSDSVRHHLVADVPVGIFLSAGLDSTTLTALATETAQSPMHTVTLGFSEYRGSDNDETALAEMVARQYRTNHETCWIARKDFDGERSRLQAAMDQPSIDGVNVYFVSKAAARTGMKVALSGLGGDELFGGYPSFRDVPRLARCLQPFRFLPALGRGFRWLAAPLLRRMASPKYAGLLEYGGTWGGAYLLRRGFFMPWELPDLLGKEMAREGWETLQPLARLDTTVNGLRSDRLKVSALELSWYMRNQLLRDADWAGMAHSLEIRVPLVDIQLLRDMAPLLASAVPPVKREMAAVPRRPLPPAVLARRKTGFSVPVREWLMPQRQDARRQERGLRGWARQVLPV